MCTSDDESIYDIKLKTKKIICKELNVLDKLVSTDLENKELVNDVHGHEVRMSSNNILMKNQQQLPLLVYLVAKRIGKSSMRT